MHLPLVLLAIVTPPLITPPEAPAPTTWAQWRGPHRDGSVDAAWPARLDGFVDTGWSVSDLGPSYSGPLVTDNLVITTETRVEAAEVVCAYDRATGDRVWTASWPGAMSVPFFARKNGSWIRATPASADDRLYVAGMRDVLVCLDVGTGEELWRVDFTSRYGTPLPAFGFVSSPLVWDGSVFVQAGGGLCRLDAESGETQWRGLVDGGGMDSAFASPVIAELDHQPQLLVLGRTAMHGLDVQSGDVHWTRPVKSFRGMNILTPVVHDNAVFTAAYGGRAQLIDVDRADGGFQTSLRWDNGTQGYMTSPVVVNGHAYYFSRANRFVCLRLSDGMRTWVSPPPGDDYWSLVTNGSLILALGNSGRLRLIRADPERYDEVDAINVASAPTWAHLAVAGGDLVIRAQDGLQLLRWRE